MPARSKNISDTVRIARRNLKDVERLLVKDLRLSLN